MLKCATSQEIQNQTKGVTSRYNQQQYNHSYNKASLGRPVINRKIINEGIWRLVSLLKCLIYAHGHNSI